MEECQRSADLHHYDANVRENVRLRQGGATACKLAGEIWERKGSYPKANCPPKAAGSRVRPFMTRTRAPEAIQRYSILPVTTSVPWAEGYLFGLAQASPSWPAELPPFPSVFWLLLRLWTFWTSTLRLRRCGGVPLCRPEGCGDRSTLAVCTHGVHMT